MLIALYNLDKILKKITDFIMQKLRLLKNGGSMNNKEVTGQLVIIGNGFDLHFGQKTRFADYINSFSIDSKVINKLNKIFINIRQLINLENDKKEVIISQISEVRKTIQNNHKTDDKCSELWSFYLRLMLCNIGICNVINTVNTYGSRSFVTKIDKRIYDYCCLIKNEFEKLSIKDTELKYLSFWDLYFLFLRNENKMTRDSNWCDVEKQILNFYCHIMTHSASIDHPAYEDTVYDIMHDFLEGKDVDSKFRNFCLIISTLNRENAVSNVGIDNYLYNELIKFSKNFIAYLNDNYNPQSEDIYGCNMQLFLDERVADGNKYELLDFNYTNFKMNNCINLIHIHGDKDLEDNLPIIGINADDLDSNERHAFKLTKQYQLISNENYKLKELDLTNINKIIFYGHSLALADYQYFKNIFDRVNLLKSSVRLIFKYSIFDPERKEEIQKDNYDNVYNLLKHYSDDTGVDVITTLILENRLKLQEI